MKINQKLLKLLAFGIIAPPTLLISTGRSSHLSCEKLEKDYVMCQLEQQYIHGLWPTSPQDLRLAKVDLESQLHRDDDGDYYTYKTYIYSPQKKHLFHHYGRNKILAEIDQERLNILINGPIKSSLQLTRSYIWGDLFLVIPVVILGAYVLR